MEDNNLPKLDLDLSIIQSALENDPSAEKTNDDLNDQNLESLDSNNNNQQDDPHQKNPPSDSPLYHFANYLKDEGIFAEEDLEDFDGTPDALASKITKLADILAEQKLQNHTPEARKFIELLNKGVEAEEAKQIVEKSIEISKINEEVLEDSIEAQKRVIREYLAKTGVPEEDINEQLEFFEDTDKLYQKSVNYYSKLKNIQEKEEQLAAEKAEKLNKQREEEYKAQMEDLKKKVFELKEVIPGFELSKAMKEKIYKNITTPAKIEDGVPISAVGLKRMKDPVQFEITLNLLNELGVFDGKFDLLLNAGKKKSVQELENAIKTSEFFNKSSNKKETNYTQDMVDSLKDLPSFKI